MNEGEAPVKVGEIHEVSINAVGGKGDGIAKVKGFVLFVPNVKKGEYVKVRITKVLANVGFAEVIEKLERPQRESKFATITAEEMEAEEEEPESKFDDTEDFGEDLDKD
ncbi:MAG: TRAM domain-containing protein [Nanoarchaeota archaeon]|nr:TRAM domain-containing protein [Nanoarchaeota archaeon]MBU1643959.1 TRAM domain-containing protein [Nanoarchaeota archaeon]MBU1977396.1 TRAM domain-containing protein [Nanoarchaeota archaeon]